MARRPEKLRYTGDVDARGKPLRFFYGVPARNLDEKDIAKLTDEQVKDIMADPKNGSGALYVEPGSSKQDDSKRSDKKRSAPANKKRSAPANKTAPAPSVTKEAPEPVAPTEAPSEAPSEPQG